ncbi:MAG TPA: YSC84-related protein [Planctomycetota bacterium]|nr:YSC84-related protein [Planctomycetota bacterium]
MSTRIAAHAAIAAALLAVSCSTAPKSEEGKSDVDSRAKATLATARSTDPSMSNVLHRSVGYAVFPNVGKGAVGVGGAYGKGVLYENGPDGNGFDSNDARPDGKLPTTPSGYCDLTQATIGAQIGGQTYSEILVFSDRSAVERFKNGQFAFDAQATAVAVKSGAGSNARFSDGVAVFTMGETGLMLEAAVGGQRFRYQPR